MSKQVINTGTTANDGTGDDLRTSQIKVNENFTELYTRQGPVCGLRYPDLIKAVLLFDVNIKHAGDMFYISKIIKGTYSAPNYTYTIEISRTTSLASAGTLVMRYTYTGTTQLTGIAKVLLGAVGTSEYSGQMVINWSVLTDETTYTNVLWEEGGLFAYSVTPQAGGGGGEQLKTITTTAQVLDGSYPLYVFNPAADITAFLDEIANIKGQINIKNISAFNVDLSTGDGETVDGTHVETRIQAGKVLSLILYSSNYIIVAGEYVAVP